MDGATTDCAALDETVMFLSHFKDLPDPRQPGKVTYPLDEILLLCLLAVLAGAECFAEISLFGVKKLDFLRHFRPFRDGTPAHDHLGDILAVLDAEQFQRCFVSWVAALTGMPEGVIAIDGKTVRRSGNNRDRGAPRDATPLTPPGIRVRTTAVRRIKLPPSSYGHQVVAGLSHSDDAATAYTSLSQPGSAVHATRPSKRRHISAFQCYRRCETSTLLVLSFNPLRGPFGPSAAEAAYYALC